MLNKLLKQKSKCDALPSELQNHSGNMQTETKSIVKKFNKYLAEIGETLKGNIANDNAYSLVNTESASNEITELCQVRY